MSMKDNFMNKFGRVMINSLLSITIVITFAFIGGFHYIGEKFNIDVLISLGDYIKGENILGIVCFALLIYLSLTKTSLKNYIYVDNIIEDIEKMKSSFEKKSRVIDIKLERVENKVSENGINILEVKKQSLDIYKQVNSIKNDDIPRLNNLCYLISVKIIELSGRIITDNDLEKGSKELINQLDILNKRIYK